MGPSGDHARTLRGPIIRRLPHLLVMAALVATGLLTSPAVPARAATALPATPAAWPSTRLELGLADAPGGAAALRASAAFEFRYQYLAGGANTGNGWATWNTDGQFVTWYIQDSVDHGMTPVFPYYMLLQSNPSSGSTEQARDLSNLANTSTMAAWYADLRLFFQRAAGDATVVLHVEPDLWGYIEQASTGDDATTVPAAVASSGDAALAGLPNNAAGFARAIVRLRDQLAPNVAAGVPPLGLGHELGHRLLEQLERPGRRARRPRRRVLRLTRRGVRPDLHRHRRPRRLVQGDRLRGRRRIALGRRRLRAVRPFHQGLRGRDRPPGRRVADPPRQHEDAVPGQHLGPLPGQPGGVVPRGSGRDPSRPVARRRRHRAPVRWRRRWHDLRLRRPG